MMRWILAASPTPTPSGKPRRPSGTNDSLPPRPRLPQRDAQTRLANCCPDERPEPTPVCFRPSSVLDSAGRSRIHAADLCRFGGRRPGHRPRPARHRPRPGRPWPDLAGPQPGPAETTTAHAWTPLASTTTERGVDLGTRQAPAAGFGGALAGQLLVERVLDGRGNALPQLSSGPHVADGERRALFRPHDCRRRGTRVRLSPGRRRRPGVPRCPPEAVAVVHQFVTQPSLRRLA